jgi:hypothetical protein
MRLFAVSDSVLWNSLRVTGLIVWEDNPWEGLSVADVVYLSGHPARSSAGARAASSTSASAVNPALRARGVAKRAVHHSAGIESRWCHLRAESADTPMSEAMAPGERQSPITSRKVLKRGDMPPSIGQSVLKSKANLSHDTGPELLDPAGMDRMSESEEKAAFIQRTRLAREARFPEGQKPMYKILGIDQGTYKQYEIRTPLPRKYIPLFCHATGVTMEWLLAGEGRGPNVVGLSQPAPKPKKRARKPRKVRAA